MKTIYCDSSTTEACVVVEGDGAWFQGYDRVVTNNTGEYLAVQYALKVAKKHGWQDVRVLTDSELVVNQLSGNYKCKKLHLRELRDDTLGMFQGFYTLSVEWVSREDNPAGKVLEKRKRR